MHFSGSTNYGNGHRLSAAGALEILVEAKDKGSISPEFIHVIVTADKLESAAGLAMKLHAWGITDAEMFRLAYKNSQDSSAEKILTELIKNEAPMSPESVRDALNRR